MPSFANDSDFNPHDPVTARSLDAMKAFEESIQKRRQEEKRFAGESSPKINYCTTSELFEKRCGVSESLYHDAETARSLDFLKGIEDSAYQPGDMGRMQRQSPSPVMSLRDTTPTQPRLVNSLTTESSSFDPHDPETAKQLDMLKAYEEKIHQRRGATADSTRSPSPDIKVRHAELKKPVEIKRRSTPPKYGLASHLFAVPSYSKWEEFEEEAEREAQEKEAEAKKPYVLSSPTHIPLIGSTKRSRVFDDEEEEDYEDKDIDKSDDSYESDEYDELDYGVRSYSKRRCLGFNSSRF
ncbi:hypothetical protein F4810DRAFT_45234 [Camillea tinctor]|nr:hypothetical protein F4810DRAFT_45234 [Camillea tinctor]